MTADTAGEIPHEMPSDRLIGILQSLPAGAVVVPNRVRNLAVFHQGVFVGWIDFAPRGQKFEPVE